MNNCFPINLNLTNKKCLVIGGGSVAGRKVVSLLECDAEVTVVSLEFTQKLKELSLKNTITCVEREFHVSDLNGAFLVICATNDQLVNKQVADECAKNNILVNVVDAPDKCNFLVPATLRRGALCLSVSTSGVSPTLARKIKEDLADYFGPEYEQFLEILKDIRYDVINKYKEPASRKRIFESLVYSDILDLIKNSNEEKIQERIKQCLE